MKKTIFILFAGVATLFTACDSSSSNGTSDPTATATSLNRPAKGDLIKFNSTTTTTPLLSSLTLEGVLTSISNTGYIYEKTGASTFRIRESVQVANSLPRALGQVIGAPTTLSSRFRQLIFRDNAVFTADEIREIVSILNPVDARLVIDPNNPLQINSSNNRTYNFTVTSNNADKIIGSMGGNYEIKESNFVVGFRQPNANELNRYRFLTNKHKIPFVTAKQNINQTTEQGKFTLELKNVNNAPR